MLSLVETWSNKPKESHDFFCNFNRNWSRQAQMEESTISDKHIDFSIVHGHIRALLRPCTDLGSHVG